jgi:hypothetical protein
MMCEHHFQPTTDISDVEWHDIKHDIAIAFDQILYHPESLPEEAESLHRAITNGDCETVINHYSDLFETQDNQESIVFNGLNSDAGETFVLERDHCSCPHGSSVSCNTEFKPYDWFVRAVLLIVQSHSPYSSPVATTAPSDSWEQTANWLSIILNKEVSFHTSGIFK